MFWVGEALSGKWVQEPNYCYGCNTLAYKKNMQLPHPFSVFSNFKWNKRNDFLSAMVTKQELRGIYRMLVAVKWLLCNFVNSKSNSQLDPDNVQSIFATKVPQTCNKPSKVHNGAGGNAQQSLHPSPHTQMVVGPFVWQNTHTWSNFAYFQYKATFDLEAQYTLGHW